MQDNVTDSFIDLLTSIESNTIPSHVLHHAKRCLLDFLGAAYVGADLLCKKTDLLADNLGASNGNTSVIGSSRKTDLSSAIFINGVHAHYAELDDGVIAGIIHPGAPIFSALLPWAEKMNSVSGELFLRGVVLGYESCVRLAEAIQPSHKACGYHATATCGSIGTAIAVCSMLNESFEVKKNALSAAAVRTGGSLKVLEDSSELKPVNSGHAALIGHTAIALAKANFLGPDDALMGKAGFIQMMSNEYDLDRLLQPARGAYRIENTYFKPYAACRYCHPAIDATLQIRAEENIDLNKIVSISVYTYELAVLNHDHQEIKGVSSAKMSIPVSVAIALVTGKAGIEEYTKIFLDNSLVQTLAKRVDVKASDLFTKQFPEKSSAEVKIVLSNGKQLQRTIEFPKGEPDYPLSDDELTAKFKNLASFSGLRNSDSSEMAELVWNLPNGLDRLITLIGKCE